MRSRSGRRRACRRTRAPGSPTVAKRRAIDGWRRRERYDERLSAIAHDLETEQADAAGALPWDPDRIDDDVLRSCSSRATRCSRGRRGSRSRSGSSAASRARRSRGRSSCRRRPCSSASCGRRRRSAPRRCRSRCRIARSSPSVSARCSACSTSSSTRATRRARGRSGCARSSAVEAIRLGRQLAELVPRRTRGARARRAHGAHGRPVPRAARPQRRPGDAHRAGPLALGSRRDLRGPGGARARRRDRARPGRLRAAGGDRRMPRRRGIRGGHRLAADRGALRGARAARAVARRRAQPRRRGVDGGGAGVGLRIVDALAASGALARYHLLPSVRAELLERLGRHDEAREEFARAARLTANERERAVLLARAATGAPAPVPSRARPSARFRVPRVHRAHGVRFRSGAPRFAPSTAETSLQREPSCGPEVPRAPQRARRNAERAAPRGGPFVVRAVRC